MCEFRVFLDGKQVAEDIIYVRQEKDKVVLRGIVGESQSFDGTQILEIDVFSTRLVLGHK